MAKVCVLVATDEVTMVALERHLNLLTGALVEQDHRKPPSACPDQQDVYRMWQADCDLLESIWVFALARAGNCGGKGFCQLMKIYPAGRGRRVIQWPTGDLLHFASADRET